MTSAVTIRKEVRDLKRAILPRPSWSFVVAMPWRIGDPHGRYGYQRVVIENDSIRRFEAAEEEQQRALMRRTTTVFPST